MLRCVHTSAGHPLREVATTTQLESAEKKAIYPHTSKQPTQEGVPLRSVTVYVTTRDYVLRVATLP